LLENTSASNNTAVGKGAMQANTTGAANTAVGYTAFAANTTASGGVAIGNRAMDSNTTGDYNVGIGHDALGVNTTGTLNTAVGATALDACTEANNGSAFGYAALGGVTTGSDNSAFGVDAGKRITSGTFNACFGKGAGEYITTGYKNTIIGSFNGNEGGFDLRTANNNIVVSDGDGNVRLLLDSNGNMRAPAVYNGNTSSTAANVFIGSTGYFGRSTSSRRYKNTITDATHGLSELLTLRPITYKGNNDGDTVFGGLIAEEVHDAGLPEFVIYDDDNEPDALAYGNMVSLCIKAIQELKTELDAAKARIATLEGE
jgi:hypothetical protein